MKKQLTPNALRAIAAICSVLILAVASIRPTDAQNSAELCREKQEGLVRLEAEAAGLRKRIDDAEAALRTLQKMTPAQVDKRLGELVERVEFYKRKLKETDLDRADRLEYEGALAFDRLQMDILRVLKTREFTLADDLYDTPEFRRMERELNEVRQRQKAVGSQIFLLRESIESLKCESSSIKPRPSKDKPEPGDEPDTRTDSSVPELGGIWYREGDTSRPASIQQTGTSLVFINENGNKSKGYFEGLNVVVADDWQGGLRGRLNSDRTRIDWANDTTWQRGGASTSIPNIGGTWYREGDRSRPAYVTQSAGIISFTNEFGNKSRGHFESSFVVVADEWQGGLRGRLNGTLTRIDWANGTTWQR
jgi:hypothetical protein